MKSGWYHEPLILSSLIARKPMAIRGERFFVTRCGITDMGATSWTLTSRTLWNDGDTWKGQSDNQKSS